MSDLMIYGEIGWDVSASSVVSEIRNAAPGNLNVRINTPGGSVFEALAIATHLKARGDVTTMIDALAASMGSIIFLAGSRRIMAPGTLLMIHNPSSGAWGEAEDLRKEAGVLDVIANEMAKLYADASGGKLDVDAARKMMDDETWLTPEQAMEYGFCHEIAGKATAFARLTERTMYRKTPKEVTMSVTTNETEKPGLLDRIMARVRPGADVVAQLDALRGEHDQTVVALADAVAKVTEAEAKAVALEAEKTALAAEIEAMKAEHVKALEDAKIQGAQEFAAKGLMDNSPAPLPHVEATDESGATHSAKWQALYDAKKFSEAAEYRKAHLKEIQEGR